MTRIRRLFAALALGGALVLGGCGTAPAPAPGAHGGTLVDFEPGDAGTMDPLFATDSQASLYDQLVFDTLVDVGPGLGVRPGIATAWRESPDRLHWTVDLRPGVVFSDGVPLDSRDVVFTYRRMIDPRVGAPYAGAYDYLRDVVAEGPFRVRFDLSRAYAPFVTQGLGLPIVPAHLLARLRPSDLRSSGFGERPVGAGPYLLARWSHDDEVDFVANPRFWRGKPAIERIAIRIAFDEDEVAAAMRRGEGDLTEVGSAVYREMRRTTPTLRYFQVPSLYQAWVAVDLRVPGLDDVVVRRAMMRAWNRRAVVERLFHGADRVNQTLVPLGLTAWHDTAVRGYAYDPVRARRELDADGWRVGPDGVRTRDGRRLAFELLFGRGDAGATLAPVELQRDLAAVGIRVTLHTLDFATLVGRVDTMHYDLVFQGFGGATDPDAYLYLHSSQIVPKGLNVTGYANSRVDRLLAAGQTEPDTAKRRRIYDAIQRITTDDLPYLPAFDGFQRNVLSRRLDVHGDREPGLLFWWNVDRWTLAR